MSDIKEKIKAELKKRGLPEKLSDFLKIEKDEEIELSINALAEIGKVESLTDILAKNPNLKNEIERQAQSEFDKKIDQALKKYENTLKEKYDFIEKGKKQGGENSEIEELKKTIQGLTQTVKDLTEKQTKEALRAQFLQKAKEKKIPENFAKKFTVESIDKLDEALVIAEKEYTDFKQHVLLETFGEGGIPRSSFNGETLLESEIQNFAKNKGQVASDSGIIGKKL